MGSITILGVSGLLLKNDLPDSIAAFWVYDGLEKGVNWSETLMSFRNSVICKIAIGKKYGCEYEEVEFESGQRRRSRLVVLLNKARPLLAEFYFLDHFPLMGWIDRLRGTLGRLDKSCAYGNYLILIIKVDN